MLASLPMYDLPELSEPTQSWWSAVARHAGIDVDLSRPTDLMAHWTAPDLLFSQTCGYPRTHALAGRVRYLATPCYRAEGCEGPNYRSAVWVAERSRIRTLADARGATVAINGIDSQSGCNVLRIMTATLGPPWPFFGRIMATGAHAASLQAVQCGTADLAAVDCVSIGLLRAVRPQALEGLRVLTWSPPAPGLPYVTSLRTPADQIDALRRGLQLAAADPRLQGVRTRLLIERIAVLDLAAYDVIPTMRQEAQELGLIELNDLP